MPRITVRLKPLSELTHEDGEVFVWMDAKNNMSISLEMLRLIRERTPSFGDNWIGWCHIPNVIPATEAQEKAA